MDVRIIAVLTVSFVAAAAHGATGRTPAENPAAIAAPSVQLVQRRKTCKQVSSCEEAVILWCSGYRRADGDNDGIPCENVCRSKKQVDAIRREIGC